MVSETELVERLRELLSTSDLNTTTTGSVRRKLEEEFGIDLSDKKAFIRQQVDLYLQEAEENDEDDNKEEDDGEAEGEDEEEEEEEEVESNEGKSTGKARSKKKNEEVKKRRGGFNKLCRLSPQLEKFTGAPELPRTEVVKLIWSYIRENSLQDPSNKRNILCDNTLKDLFDVDAIDMFQMNKALAKHIWPLGSDGVSASSTTPKEKQQKHDREEDVDEAKRKKKRQKGGQRGGNSGFLAPVRLSDALMKFLGTGDTALSRSDVVKRIWEYIKLHDLQDPSDRRMILCDEKLKELFDVDTFQAFTVTKLLTSHFIKAEE